MAYIINKTNGTQIAVVEDGTIDQTTDLKLVGKNYLLGHSRFTAFYHKNEI